MKNNRLLYAIQFVKGMTDEIEKDLISDLVDVHNVEGGKVIVYNYGDDGVYEWLSGYETSIQIGFLDTLANNFYSIDKLNKNLADYNSLLEPGEYSPTVLDTITEFSDIYAEWIEEEQEKLLVKLNN